MSGGSFDYFYRRMEDGGFQADAWQLKNLPKKLRGYIAGVYSNGEPREHETHDGQWRRFNDEERARLQRDGALALAQFDRLRAALAEAKRLAASLSDVAHSIEWAENGDSCADAVLESVTKFAAENPKP
jgi:hypothetical protein